LKKDEDWFEKNRYVYQSELKAIGEVLPQFRDAVEIGVGSGRFAKPLGITRGLEPSKEMARIAESRGIEVTEGIAEDMPYNDLSFDLALMVTTLCFLDDVEKAFSETYRILQPGGYFIIAFVDKNSRLGRTYQKIKHKSVFYRPAVFYSVEEVKDLLVKTGFVDFAFTQTIFSGIEDIREVEKTKIGYGAGSFVVVRARKPKSNLKV